MKRGDLYRVRNPGGADPKRSWVFVVVSRQTLVDARFSTVVCAPVYSRRDGLATQVEVGAGEGLEHESSIHCDALVGVQKALLKDFVGSLDSPQELRLDQALRVALGLA